MTKRIPPGTVIDRLNFMQLKPGDELKSENLNTEFRIVERADLRSFLVHENGQGEDGYSFFDQKQLDTVHDILVTNNGDPLRDFWD